MQNRKFKSGPEDSVKVLLMDAVGTLIHLKQPVAEYYAAAACSIGLDVTPLSIRERFSQTFRHYFMPWQDQLSLDWQARELAWKERYREMDAWLGEEQTVRDFHQYFQLSVTEDTEESNWRSLVNSVFFEEGNRQPELNNSPEIQEALFRSLWDTFSQPDVWQVIPNAIPWVTKLQTQGILVCLASNFDSRLQNIVDGHRQSIAVDQTFVSSTVGFRKPDPRFYLTILEGLNVAPECVMMIGDRWWEDYASPTVCGIRSWLYAPNDSRSGSDNPRIISSLNDIVL